jgi:mono/diheme cytochrome c family protein
MHRSVKFLSAVSLALVACASSSANKQERSGDGASAAAATAARVERGRVLVTVGGCNDCHTPMKFDPAIGMPVPQMDRMLSGHPAGAPDPSSDVAGHDAGVIGPTFTSFKLPFGVVYAMNLTPDVETGLGSWTEDMFVRAVKTGRHFGGTGRPIMPPMPWQNLAQQSDDDLKAIFAYLRSIPPVRNGIPDIKVPQPVQDQIRVSYDKMLALPPFTKWPRPAAPQAKVDSELTHSAVR